MGSISAAGTSRGNGGVPYLEIEHNFHNNIQNKQLWRPNEERFSVFHNMPVEGEIHEAGSPRK